MSPIDSMPVDFGQAADDYARHRPGFPPAFFDRAHLLGLGLRGQRVLDLGTGTGTLACGFAERGCDVVALDPSPGMLAQARQIAASAKLDVRFVEARAEVTGLPDGYFDLVCAGQCWHWFDRGRAAAEAMRVLRPGGHVLIAYFSYLPDPGSVGAATEELLLRHNPAWPMAGLDGRYAAFADDLAGAGFCDASTFDFVVPIRFTHEAWRGRFRACNGVIAMPPATAATFDADLTRLLAERFPEPIVSDHRIFGIAARKPRESEERPLGDHREDRHERGGERR